MKKNDLDSDEESQCVDFDNPTDVEASLDSKRLASCPFIDYEAEDTRNFYDSDDCDVAMCSLKKKQRLRKPISEKQKYLERAQ